MKAIPHPSPNFGERRDGALPNLIVLHYTAMPSADEALHRLCDPSLEVSAHYLIAEDGRIFSLVDETCRAWHAGAGAWGQVTDVNSVSIGIELANPGNAPFAAPLMRSLEGLLGDLLERHSVSPERVIGHSDCAPGRKMDPGPRFDWQRLARAGLSIWPEKGAAEGRSERCAADLRTIGYTADVPPEVLLSAFRLRFRPGATGPLSAEDAGLAAALARRWPVDQGRAGS